MPYTHTANPIPPVSLANIGAYNYLYYIVGVPYYDYGIVYPKTLF